MSTRAVETPAVLVVAERTGPASSIDARRTVTVLAATCAAVVAMRVVYTWQPLRSDEAGYLLVARNWEAGEEFLYGDYHVDRPPLLLAIFRVAALSDWDRAIRVLAIPFAVVAVLALARAGFLLAGQRGARWSGVVAAALVSSPALAADQADGELFAVPFVAASVAMSLEAWRRAPGPAQLGCAVAAGALGSAALLVKQNFLEGLLFVGILVLAESLRRRRVSRRCHVVALGAIGGALVPIALAIGWAAGTGVEPAQLWADLVTFRGSALAVIWEGSLRRPLIRAGTLVVVAVVSGMVAIAWIWLRRQRAQRWRCSPEEWAVTGSLAFGTWALVMGGSFWLHYLLQLVPGLALAAGMVATTAGPAAAAMRGWVRVAVASSVLASVAVGLAYATVPYTWHQERIGRWLAEASIPSDTAFVAYGNPGILEAADIDSPYPYVWSLPMRTLDPSHDRLIRTLTGPDAPTWIVQVGSLNAWHIDSGRRLRDVVGSRYDRAAVICGHQVFLRSGSIRDLPTPPDC